MRSAVSAVSVRDLRDSRSGLLLIMWCSFHNCFVRWAVPCALPAFLTCSSEPLRILFPSPPQLLYGDIWARYESAKLVFFHWNSFSVTVPVGGCLWGGSSSQGRHCYLPAEPELLSISANLYGTSLSIGDEFKRMWLAPELNQKRETLVQDSSFTLRFLFMLTSVPFRALPEQSVHCMVLSASLKKYISKNKLILVGIN